MSFAKTSFRFPKLTIFLWILICMAAGNLTWSCVKENPEPDTPPVTHERPYPAETVQPEDWAAFVDPAARRLYVDPQYVDAALEQFGAQPLTNDAFVIVGKSFAGYTVKYPVQIVLMPSAAIAETANVTISALNDVVLQGVDSLTGTPMRLRRNRECGQSWSAFVTECSNFDKGTSTNTHYMAAKTCQPKDGAFCPEEYGVWAIRYTYSTKGCGGTPVEIKPERQWVCKG